jgi:hypothetical protein
MMVLLRKNTATHPLQLRHKSRRVQSRLRRKMSEDEEVEDEDEDEEETGDEDECSAISIYLS